MSDQRPEYQSGVGVINGTQFHWGSGSPGRYWSIPYGDYPVTPNAPTGAWAHSVGAIPINNNIIPDPVLQRNRVGIMIHPSSSDSLDHLYTQGCFAVAPSEWPAVRQQILDEAQKGPLYLHVQPGQAAAFTHTSTLSAAGAPPADQSPPGTTVNSTGPSRPVTPTPGPTLFAGVNSDARGMRNNNPGNLVASNWTASLPGYKGTDGKFAIFDTPEHGAAALDANLSNYASKGINTPFGVASTWAPASDNNNPNSYGAQIAKGLGVGLNDKIDLTDPTVRNKIANSIALVENGPGKSTGVRVAYAGSGGSGAAPSTQQSTVGNAIAALTKGPGGEGNSDLANTLMGKSSQFGPAGGGAPTGDQGQGLQLQQAAAGMGNQRQQLIQMQAQQLAAQLQQRAQQPLAWGSAPYGAGAGQQQPMMQMAGQMPPGVTLNSMGGSYV